MPVRIEPARILILSNEDSTWTPADYAEIDLEIARLASICKVPLLDPGVIERVLHNDPTVCGSSNARAFDKLRQLLMMHYTVRDRVVGTLGEPETQQIVREIVEQLRHRIGDKLGGAGGA